MLFRRGVYPFWIILGATLYALPLAARAQWYEWRDADGTRHVTNQFTETSDRSSGPVAMPFGAASQISAPATEPVPAVAAAPALDGREEELRRREVRVGERRAHLELLRRSRATRTADQLELENLLDDEVRAEVAAIGALRRQVAETVP